MGSLPRLETHQHRNYTGAQQAAPCTPHFFVLSQSLSAALHRPHAATDVVRLCAHLNQTLNHANSSVPHGMLPARKSEVNRNPGSGVTPQLRGESVFLCHCEERMVGQASSLSIRDDGQDARPTGNLSFGAPEIASLRSQ